MIGIPLYLTISLEKEKTVSTFELDSNSNKGDTYKVQIPISLPYSQDWDSPVKSAGLMEVNGDFFTVLNRQLKNDTLTIEYVKNVNAKEIFSLLSDYVDNSGTNNQDNNSSNLINLLNVLQRISPVMWQSVNHFLFVENIKNNTLDVYSNLYQNHSAKLKSPPPKFV